MGGFSETWAAVGTASCRVSPAMVQNVERISADRMVSVTSWVISFPSGTDVTAKDRIQSQSAAYEVTAPMTPHSDAAVCRVQAVMAL